jgi:hypothetical protein
MARWRTRFKLTRQPAPRDRTNGEFLAWGIGWGTDSQPLVKIINKQVDTRDRDPLPLHFPPLCAGSPASTPVGAVLLKSIKISPLIAILDQRCPGDYLRNSELRPQKPSRDHWYSVGIRTSRPHTAALLTTRDNKIAVELATNAEDAEEVFRELNEQKDAIEKAIGEPLDWREMPDEKASHSVGSPMPIASRIWLPPRCVWDSDSAGSPQLRRSSGTERRRAVLHQVATFHRVKILQFCLGFSHC